MLFLLFGLIILSPKINGQTRKTDLSFAIKAERIFTQGDLNEYWGNSYAFGAGIQYGISLQVDLDAELVVAKFSSSKKVPDFYFVLSKLGLKFHTQSKLLSPFFVGAGISNNSFIFLSKQELKMDDNNVEHELGVYFSFGVKFNVAKHYAEVFIEQHNVFSEPYKIKFITIGVKYQIF